MNKQIDKIDTEWNSKDQKKLSPEEVKRQLIEMAKKWSNDKIKKFGKEYDKRK